MAKVTVEFEVPDGKYCKTCNYFRYVSSDFGVCNLFGRTILLKAPDRYPERCDKCKKAEAEMNTNENKFYNLLNDIYRKFDTGEYVKIPSMRKIGESKWVVYFYENGLIHNGIYYTEERARRKLEQVNGG